jgi:hypothetical protein
MKNLLLILFAILIFAACNLREKAADAATKGVEQLIESKTGTEVNLPNTDAMENNAGFVSYQSERKTYLTGNEKMQATALFQKDKDGLAIALQLVGEDGRSFMATIHHIPEDFALPLKAKFAVSNQYDGVNPVATVMFMGINENGVQSSEMPFEGEMIISQLSETQIAFEIDAKGSDATDANSPSNWKKITGKGKLVQPIIVSQGIDKINVLK